MEGSRNDFREFCAYGNSIAEKKARACLMIWR
jgi:hypothetical protein